MKILIAINSAVFTELLAPSLSMYDVHTCDNGTDALALLETMQPEILLLDLSLPVIDGLTLLRRSCYRPRYILALTNLVNQYVLKEAAAVGVQDMILIPCTIRHIIEHLNALIEKAPSTES